MKRIIHAAAFASIIFCLSCGGKKNDTEGKSVFRYNEPAGLSTLDPAFSRDQAHIWICNQLYNGLLQLDEQLNIQPCIAHSYSISEDGLTYTFFLRKDVFFHDHFLFPGDTGRRVTAGDFVFSFNRLADEKTASPGVWILNEVKRMPDGSLDVTAINDSTLRIVLERPFPPFAGLLSMQYCSVVPEEIVKHFGADFRKNPVGTGPFIFRMWKEGVKLVLLKNEKYFEKEGDQRLPYLDAVSVSFIADKQAAFLEFIRGNLDFLSGIDANYKDELLTRHGKLNPKYENKINLLTQPYLNTEYLGILMDGKLSPLSEKKIRQAINYGFDRVKMMKYLRNNIGTPGIYGFVPPGMPSFDSTAVRGYYYDPDKARALLTEAGYPGGKGLPVITLSTTASYLDICEYIQHQLGEIGITLKIDVNQPATLRQMIAKSEVPFFRGSWIADYPDAENYLSLFYTPNFCPKGPNYTHFSSPAYDRLYEKARNETSDSMRFLLYRDMDRIIVEEAPVVVLYYDQVLRFVREDIRGMGSNPLNLLNLKKVRKFQN
jgi:oligopeptide transport system substrate-binding protein